MAAPSFTSSRPRKGRRGSARFCAVGWTLHRVGKRFDLPGRETPGRDLSAADEWDDLTSRITGLLWWIGLCILFLGGGAWIGGAR